MIINLLFLKIMEQNVFSMPKIGEKAPEFKAVTTQGEINFPGDYRESWVILFSHPADFTPVCTSEFMTFASMEKQFKEAQQKIKYYYKTYPMIVSDLVAKGEIK